MTTFDHISGLHFNIDGAKIYYEETGDKRGLVLLMLHGGFGTIEDFNQILPELSENFRIIGVDSRGQGKSTLGNERLTYQRMQLDIESLLHSLSIKKVSILGFSDGGMIGYRMGISCSLKIEQLVAIDAPWSLSDLSATENLFSKITPESWREKFPESYDKYLKLNPDIDFELLTNALKEMWLDSGSSGGYPNELVNQITCPTLIVRGDNDHLFSRKSATELADSIRDSIFLNIPFAEHESFKDQPEIFKIAVNTFLKNNKTTANNALPKVRAGH